MRTAALSTAIAALILGVSLGEQTTRAAETVSFNSATTPPSKFQLKKAKEKGIELKQDPGTRLIGFLSKPEGAGPFPAVVLLHGCRGIQPFQKDWASKLMSWGYVVLLVDSFGPRNTTETCTSLFKLSYQEVIAGRVFDAYGALAYLADLSFVVGKRVAVMGWPRTTVLGAVAETGTRTLFENTFRAAVAFYPDCGYTTSGRFSAPVMVLIGAKDDWTPAVLCQRMAKASQGSSIVVQVTVYPEAYHSFDDPDIGALYSYGEAENEHKSPARGATLGYHRESHEDAIRRVREFLSARLR